MKRNSWILLAIISLTLILRLSLAFAIPNFTYESYFHLRHIEYIASHGLPLYHDPLSYGGRTLIFLPAYHYLFAFFSLFFPLETIAKLLANLLLVSLIPLVYLLAKKLTQKENPSLFSAFLAAFIPFLWQPNSLSPVQLFLPLALLALYSLISLNRKEFIYLYLFSFFLLSLTSSATFLVVIGLLLYLLLSKIEEKKIPPEELELALFSLFFFLWLQFLFFKNILLAEGPRFIWQNIPSPLIAQYFPRFSILHSLLLVGLVPLLTGIYVLYKSFFREKNRHLFLFFSLALSTILLFILNLIELKITLLFLSLIFAIIFSQYSQLFAAYLKRTKLDQFKIPVLILIILLFLLTAVYPSLSFALEQSTPSPEEIKAFLWLRENAPPDAAVLTSLGEGHLLTYLSRRKNFMDDQFSLIKKVETRFDHLNSLFTTPYQTQAINLLNQYNLTYLFISPQAKKEYNLTLPPYLDEKCFELVYSNVVWIYKAKCQLQLTKP